MLLKAFLEEMKIMKSLVAIVLFLSGFALNAQNKELKTYFESGSVKSIYSYADAANYTVQNFYPNGKLQETGTFVNGKMNGTWVSYLENGQKSGEAFYANGVKTGDWKIYDQTGVLKYSITYANDKMVNAVSLDANGQHIAETSPR